MQIIANLEQVVRQRAADLLSNLNPARLEGAERRDPALMDSRRLSRRTHTMVLPLEELRLFLEGGTVFNDVEPNTRMAALGSRRGDHVRWCGPMPKK
jgi:hypothetical protein